MNIKLIATKYLALAAVACTAFFLSHPAQAQTFTDNAANPLYAKGYSGRGGETPGFGAFQVVCTGVSAGTFVASASEAEAGSGTVSGPITAFQVQQKNTGEKTPRTTPISTTLPWPASRKRRSRLRRQDKFPLIALHSQSLSQKNGCPAPRPQ